VCCAPASAMACGTSWYSGRACLGPRRHGSRSTPSARSTPRSSSRTSCSSRRGEMLWWARYTRGGTKVAAKVHEQSRRSPATFS
jgi:hypothetical protein